MRNSKKFGSWWESGERLEIERQRKFGGAVGE